MPFTVNQWGFPGGGGWPGGGLEGVGWCWFDELTFSSFSLAKSSRVNEGILIDKLSNPSVRMTFE